MLLTAIMAAACDAGPRFAAASSTIVLAPEGESVWLTSPDDDSVVQIDATTLELRSRIAIEGSPEQLAWVDGTLVVTLSQAGEVALVELGAEPFVRRMRVPCGGTGAVVPDGKGGALVSCPNDDRVLRLRPQADAPDWVIASPGRPTALAVLDDRFAVSASRTGVVRVHEVREGAVLEEIALETRRGLAAISVDALAADPRSRGFTSIYQRVDHDSDRTRPAERGGYGSVVDGSPRIEPMLGGACGSRYARFDGGARVASGPSALAASRDGSIVWVAHRYTDDVMALRCEARDPVPRLATFEIGRGPRGIVTRDDGRVAFVDVGFAHAVARLELPVDAQGPEGPVLHPALERTRPLGAIALSDAALRGRALFFDAEDTHLTPSGIVTCGTCHPSGGDDGLTWFFHTRNVAPKVRRTPPAWGARTSLAPHHWDGELADAATLAHTTIRELMEGDALLVDTGAMAAWMDEAPIPPGRPLDAGERELAERGRALFDSDEVGCARCHTGALFSDARPHRVLAPSLDPLAEIELAYTPPLRAVRARPPYLHDGRAPTLESVLTDHDEADLHARTSHLTSADLEALVLYLETL